MASPTDAQIIAQFNLCCLWLNENEKQLRSNTPNVQTLYDDIVRNDGNGLNGDFATLALGAADELRAECASTVSTEIGQRLLGAWILEYGKLKKYPETEVLDILDRLFRDMDTDSEAVTSRVFTYGTPSAAGGNTGDGVLNRLTTDAYGYAIENATPEDKVVRCTQDRNSGVTVHEEVFEVRGEEVPRDAVSGYVSGDRDGEIRSLSSDNSETFVSNPTFASYTETTLPAISELTDWAVAGAISDLEMETTAANVYRVSQNEGDSPAALRFLDNEKISQAFSVKGAALSPTTPYYCQIAYKPESSADGTLTLRVGSNSKAVAISGTTWQILRLDLDENLFLRNFNESTLDIEIELASRTTGTVLVDDLIFAPMTFFDGTYWAMVGGATPALVEDQFTISDSATESIVQKWLWRLWGRYLPHATGGSVTWAEPS